MDKFNEQPHAFVSLADALRRIAELEHIAAHDDGVVDETFSMLAEAKNKILTLERQRDALLEALKHIKRHQEISSRPFSDMSATYQIACRAIAEIESA